jgi:hypothetical protein
VTRQRPRDVALNSIFTVGIYWIIWLAQTTKEMRARGADIPTMWIGVIPVFGYWWFWRYAQAVKLVTGGRIGTFAAFVCAAAGALGTDGVLQYFFNQIDEPVPTA